MSFSLLTNQGMPPRSIGVSNQSTPASSQAKTLPYLARLAGSSSDTLDLTNQQAQGVIDQIQSVYVDNSGNGAALSITSTTGQVIICPAESQGWFPVLSSNPPVFQFASGGGTDVPLFFTNVPMPVGTWSATASRVSQALPIVSFSVFSANPSASTELMPFDPDRGYLVIKAPEADDLWINPNGGVAAVDAIDCFKIAAGGVYESLTEAWPGPITYYCATTGAVITAFSG